MKSSLETENNFKLFKIELLPMNDNSNSYGNVLEKYKFTGHERDQNTNYDYMHFRFYASSMGRFLKPDNIIPDLTNPQNWNAYTYVKGNPVNFNDPSGHSEDQPLQQENKQNEQVGPTQPANQNQEAMKKQEQKMVDQPKKVDVNKAIAQLISTGQVGSLKVTSDVQKALQDNPAFRKGFEAWLSTSTGKQQFEEMSSDKNTQYIIELGRPTFGTRGETVVSIFNTNKTDGGQIDVKIARILIDSELRKTYDSFNLAITIAHEGYHALAFGSGKYTEVGAGHISQRLDSDSGHIGLGYSKMKRYYEELSELYFSENK